MKSNKSHAVKLLLVGAFLAFTQFSFGQSISVQHFENGTLRVPSIFTNNIPRLCATDSVQLEATGFAGTLSWSGPSGTISATSTTIWVDEQGTYYVSDGTNNASVTIGKDGSNPLIYSDDYPVTSSSNNGVGSYENVKSPAGGLVGLFTPSKDYLAPFGAEYANNKQQYLYTSNELQNLGLEDGSTVKEIGFYLNESWSSNCNTQVEIRVYQTSNTTLTDFVTGSSNYLGSWGCLNYQSGWNYFDLSDFNWNGTDNLVFEFCYNSWSNPTAQNPLFALDNVGFSSSVVIANLTSVCNSSSGFAIADYRPSTAFKYSNPARKDTIVLCGSSSTLKLTETAASYAWSSLNSTYTGTTNTLSVSSDDLVYITGLTSQFCKYDDTVQVFSAAESVPTITSSSTDFCSGESVTLSTSLSSDQSARWSNGSSGNQITVSDGGTYTVTVSNDFGCSKTSIGQVIVEVEKPELFLTNDGFEVLNESHHFIGNKKFKKLFNDGSGKLYFFSDASMQISDLPSLLISNNSSATPTSIDNATEDQQIHNAHNNYHTTIGGVYQLGISGRYQHQDASVIWDNGSNSSYTNWDVNNIYASANNTYIAKYYYNDKWEANGNTWSQVLVEYNQNDLKLISGEIFCDSVQLFAPTEFDSFVWSTGETTSSIWVSGNGSHSVYVTGSYTKSDGTTCSLTSDTYTFTINASPSLSVTNNSGTTDLTGSNTISLTAVYGSGASIAWSTGVSTDNITVSSKGSYTVTATLNGCSTSETIEIYEPIFVAKSGSNTSGNGSLSSPYLTINYAIDQATEGDKIYVLPGTYSEGELIFETSSGSNQYKSVYLASDLVRLNDSSAIASTIIDANGDEYLLNITNSNTTTIQGFTLTGQEAGSAWEGAMFRLNNGANITVRDAIIKDNTSTSYQQEAQIMNVRYNSHPVFDNVHFKNNASLSNQSRKTAFIYSNASADFIDCKWEGNYGWESIVQIQNQSSAYFENNLFINNGAGDWGIVTVEESNCTATFVNSTIKNNLSNNQKNLLGISGSSNKVVFVNSILGKTSSAANQIRNNTSTSNSFIARNSVLGHDTLSGAAYPVKLQWDVDGSNVIGDAGTDSQGALSNTSPAIGIGISGSHQIGGVDILVPVFDLEGNSRPNPAGSNPDAGAFENTLARGDFDVDVTSCGYLLSSSIYNSANYSVEWIQNGTVLGTDDDYLASSKGTYTLKVYSVDRLDTITKTVALNNPLSMEILDVSNSCEFISSNNGRVSWGNISGGTPYSSDWWTYRTAVRNESGTQIDGYWHLNNPQDYVGTKSNLAPGKYYFFIDDATGCEVGDTVEILEQVQSKYYVSTTGDDSNGGLSETDPFATISRAVSSTCKGDTVIVLDGTYFEDSITINASVVIGSKYLIDGDTNHIHNTIIDGGSSAYVFDYPYSQTSSNWADTTYNRIEALTVQNGMVVNNDRGGALTLANGRTLLINRVQFKSNSAQRGGAVLQREWSRMALKNSTFTGNEASNDGGGFYCSDGYLVLTNNHFENNSTSYHGGAMYLNSPRSLVMNNIDMVSNQANDGASGFFASLCCVGSSIDITNIRVLNGSGQMPILIHQSQSYWITFKNLLIAGNLSTQAEAMQIQDGSSKIRLINSTIVNNNLTNGSTAFLKCDWGDVDLVIWNSILDANDATAILYDNTCNNYNLTIANSYVNLPSSSLYDNNCGTTNITYSSNITTGSYYEDLANGNYAPSSVSSVLGAGSSSATVAGASLSAPAMDLLGNTRPSPTGTSPDLGAIESIESAPQLGMTSVVEHNGFCETNSGSITVNLLNYSGAASYQWKSLTDANWSWNSTQTASNLADGTYRAIASDNSTQAKLDSIDVTIVTLPTITISNLSSNANCNGDSDGELAFAIEGGNPFGTSQYSYSITFLETESAADGYVWNDGSYHFTSNSNSSPRSITFSSNNWAEDFRNGYYEVVVTDEDGCSVTDTLLLDFDHELPAVNITTLSSDGVTGLTSMCSGIGNTIDLTANVVGGGGTNSYAWSNSSTAQTIGVAQTGSYEIEVSDQFGCVGRDTMDITFQVAPQVYVGAPATKTGEPIADFVYLGEYEDHHYYHYTLTHNYNWSQAKTVAESMGAYLWSVNSRAEHEAVAQMYQSQNQVCCEAFIGAYKEGGVWKWHSGEPFTFTNWAQNEPSSPNYDTRIRIQWGWWDSQGVPGQWEDYGTEWDQQKYIFEFPSNQEFLAYSESFCDSITLYAGTPDGTEFAEYYWVDVNEDTVGIGQSHVASADIEFTVIGQFVRSDGSVCGMESSSYNVEINVSPEITFAGYDSLSNDLFSGDTLVACANSDLWLEANVISSANSVSYNWIGGNTDSIIHIESNGLYGIQVSDNFGCESSAEIEINLVEAPTLINIKGGKPVKTGDTLIYNWNNTVYLGEFEGNHYYTIQAYESWTSAKVTSEQLGGHLWIPNSFEENQYVWSLAESKGVNNNQHIGIYWNGSEWVDVFDQPLQYSNWRSTLDQPYSSYTYGTHDYWGLQWHNNQNYSNQWIIEFERTDTVLVSGLAHCDSVSIKATGLNNNYDSFNQIYWYNDLGSLLDSGEVFTVSVSGNYYSVGSLNQSNGVNCWLLSDTVEVIINSSPELNIYSSDSTYEINQDSILVIAESQFTDATYTWNVGSSMLIGDSIYIQEPGRITVTGSKNGCESSYALSIEKPLYVAKTGSDVTGTGSLSNPYKTIQHGIDMAESGGKVYVLPGTYNENLVVDKQVRLFSDFVRLGNANAKNTTIINAGFNGRAIEFSNTTRIDRDSTKIEGFTIKNGDTGGNEGSGIYASWNPGTGLTIENCVISNHRKTCCSDGIAIAIHGVDLYFTNVDIIDNGSVLYWDERSTVTLRYLDAYWDNVTFRGNEANSSLIYIHESDLVITNSDFISNTIHDNNEALMLVDWGSNLVLNHVTMTNALGQGYAIKFGNNQDQDVVIYNSVIDGFAQGGIKTQGSSNNVHVLNSVINSIPQAISGNGNISRVNAIEISSLELNLNGTLKSTSPAIGLGGSDTTVAGYDLVSPAMDLAGNMRPNPSGSMPDAGAYENVLARGEFGLQVSNCGYAISAKVVNSDAYSISISSTNGFSSNDEDVVVSLKGTYTIEAYDSLTATTLTETVSITNPLSIGYLFSRDACAANGGYGEIVVGDLFGGTAYNIPNNNWFDYYIDIYDSTGSNVVNWQVHEGEYNTWNTSITAGVYTIALSDAAGCTVYDTVMIEDLEGSKYYISTTGSDTASGLYSEPLATIAEAINRACDGDTIVMFDGEYFENVEIKSSTMPYVIIASEFIEDGDDSHIAMTKVNGMDEDPTFDIRDHSASGKSIQFVGFTVTNGKSNSNWYGGGGISAQNSNIALQDMIVSGNRSGNSGGGLGLSNCELTIENSIVENNIANSDGGGIYLDAVGNIDAVGEVIVRNNKANGNGGGIGWNGHWSTSLSLTGIVVENNEAQSNGGGLSIQNGWWNNGAEILLENLIVRNNRSLYGTGGMFINGSGNDVTLQNTVIAYNKSNSTGGLELQNADIDVVHTTIYKNNVLNATSANDQIRLNNNANVVFLNSAVGGQENIGSTTAHTFYIDDYDATCDLAIESSIVSGGLSSIDNPYSITITGTPIGQALYLMDPANGDYMLSSVSQGLGAGATTYSGVNIPSVDIYGMARPGTSGENPDVGAVESPLDTAEFGAAFEIRNNIACDETYGRLKVIPLIGSGAYKFELDDLTGTATFADQQNVSSYTYSSLYSGDYLVTITDIGKTPNVVFTDTVSVTGKDSLSLVKDVANEFCFGESNGSISLSVSGGDGYYDYTWTTATNSNFPKASALNNLGPEEYFVTVKDGDNCFVQDSVTIITLHSLPVVSITGNINKGGTITSTTNPQIRACAGDEVTLDAGSGFVTYNWTTVDGLNSWTTQTLPASYEQGFYVTAVDSFGCSNTDSAEVFYVQTPAIYASNVNTNIGASLQSVTSYVEGTSQRIGDNYNDAKPYGAGDKFAKMQFIIPASELIAEGLTDQTTINSIGFEVEVETGSPVQSFKVKMKNTTANQLTTTFETGLTQVYSLNTLTPGEGWNTHVLDNGFVWDGTKNLLVQVEYSNVAFNSASNNILGGADMSYNAAAVATGNSSVIGNTTADFTSTWRPNMKFGIDKVQATDTLRVCDFTMLNTTDDYDTYSWLVAGTSMGTQLRYSVSSPIEVVLKTVDAASSCTMYSDTVQVMLDTTPSVFVTSPSLIGCVGDTVVAAVDTVASDINYSWSNGVNDTIAEFFATGQYYLYATSPSGCRGVDTVDVSINIPPDVVMELNGRVLTSTDGSLVADNSSCDTTLILPYTTTVDTLSPLNSSEWSTYSTEYLTWEFQQGWDSLVDYTGPTYDADSSFTGGFYQFDPASLTDQNKVGYLQLGCINLLGMTSPELNFSYHMVDVYADSANTADQMGTLALEVKTASDQNWSTIWQRSGTHSSYDWVEKTIDLSAYVNKTVQLRWKGQAGVGGPRSEMGLDNISLTDSLASLSNVSGRATPETVCEGDSLYATTISNGTTNFSYMWSNGDTTAAIELTATGWYDVMVTDEKNCSVTSDSVYIIVNPAPNNLLVVTDTTQYCEGVFDSLMIKAAGGYVDYKWFMNFDGSGYTEIDSVQNLQVDSLNTGTQQFYTMITDSLGCRSVSAVVDLVQTPTPVLTLTEEDVLCNSDSTGQVSVSAVGSGLWDYTWSTGDTTASVTGLPTDWYTVQVVDQYLCEAADSIFVDEPTAVSLTVSQVENVDCYGTNSGSINIDFNGGVGGYTFSWSDTTGTFSATTEDLNNIGAGQYMVVAQDNNGCALMDTVSITEPTQLFFTVDSVLDLTCKGNFDGYIGVSATGGVMPYSFIANNDTNATGEFYNLDSNYYVLSVIDANGCTVGSGAVVSQPDPPFNDEEICVVTVDSTGVNLIVWEKTPGKRTSEYVVLTENASTQYVSIGSNMYNDMSTHADQNSNPAVRPYRYRLALIDSCGFYSDTSDYHATIHLQASQGVAANEVQLQWTAYEGKAVQTYYIYRWLSPTNRVLVDSVSANVQTYTDIYPVNTAITALLYEVGAKFVGGGCSPTTGKQASYATSMSNRLDWGTDGGLPIGTDEWVNVVLENNLEIFPNPSRGVLNVALSGAWEDEENVALKVMDIRGRTIATRTVSHGGTVRFDFSELPAGVYFVHTITDDGRIIVKRFERIN